MFRSMFVSLMSPHSDSIFLLSGVVDVVLFCTIRRVIPVKEVAIALFTGRIFRAQEESHGDTTWCIGSLETGQKCISDSELSLPVNDNDFMLRQPKFENVTPPPAALLDKIVIPPPRRARSIPRKPLPREYLIPNEDADGHDHSPIPRQGLARRLPPIPQRPRTPVLPSVVEIRGTPPPPYRPITTLHRQSQASRSVSSHSRKGSLDSVTSDFSLITVLQSTDKGSLKDDGGPSSQK